MGFHCPVTRLQLSGLHRERHSGLPLVEGSGRVQHLWLWPGKSRVFRLALQGRERTAEKKADT